MDHRSAFEVYFSWDRDYLSVVNLWCHGDGRSELRLGHIIASFGETEVSDDNIILVQKDVCEFEVSMHHFVFVEDFEAVHDLLQEEDRLFFRDQVFGLFAEELFEVSVFAVVDDEVVVVGWLHVLVEVHDVGVFDAVHDGHLVV